MTKAKPFRILKEEIVSTIGPHTFIKTELSTPANKVAIWSYMRVSDAVGVLAVDSAKMVYLVREYRLSRKDFVWSIPVGKVDFENPTEEQLIHSANRELQEEAGVKAAKLEKLASYYGSEHMTRKAHLYLGTELEESKLTPDENEHFEVKKLPFQDAFNLVTKQQVPGAGSVIAFLLGKEKLGF